MDRNKRRYTVIGSTEIRKGYAKIHKGSYAKMRFMSEDEISNVIIGCAIDIHRMFGPGLLESAYRECLYYDLSEKGLLVIRENQCR